MASIKKNFNFLFFEQAINLSVGFVTAWLLARVLSVQNFGIIKIADALLLFVSYVLSFGLEKSASHYTSKLFLNNDSSLLGYVIRLFLVIRVSTIFFLGFLLIPEASSALKLFLDSKQVSLDIRFLLYFYISFNFLSRLLACFLGGAFQRYQGTIAITFKRLALLLALVFILVLFESISIRMALSVMLFSSLLEAAILVFFTLKTFSGRASFLGLEKDFHLAGRRVLSQLRTFTISSYCGQALSFFRETLSDSLIIGLMIGPEAVAYYSIGAFFPNFIKRLSLSKVFGGALIPEYIKKDVDDERSSILLTNFLIKISIVLIMPGLLLLSSLLVYLIPLLFDSRYNESITVGQILCFSVIFSFILDSYNNFLDIKHETKTLFLSGVLSLLNLMLNLLLIPSYGIEGAAIATLVTNLTLLTFFHFSIRRKYKTFIKIWDFFLHGYWKLSFCAIAFLFVGALYQETLLGAVTQILCVVIYFYLLFRVNVFSAYETDLLRQVKAHLPIIKKISL